eukprot:CAMPEP_0184301930 /NCGR_PEP_ID=MMETSP1049-20130417/12031_1 /TAXON_ID=77928 /ORGANISM="Proteomonas sulcata, Strain CCMP704" /LENGTH=367 /DNA_ID=CAMNT_0026613075 /DNA_START=62 /DNA_END=1166 /DNA_ORIENTATION=+
MACDVASIRQCCQSSGPRLDVSHPVRPEVLDVEMEDNKPVIDVENMKPASGNPSAPNRPALARKSTKREHPAAKDSILHSNDGKASNQRSKGRDQIQNHSVGTDQGHSKAETRIHAHPDRSDVVNQAATTKRTHPAPESQSAAAKRPKRVEAPASEQNRRIQGMDRRETVRAATFDPEQQIEPSPPLNQHQQSGPMDRQKTVRALPCNPSDRGEHPNRSVALDQDDEGWIYPARFESNLGNGESGRLSESQSIARGKVPTTEMQVEIAQRPIQASGPKNCKGFRAKGRQAPVARTRCNMIKWAVAWPKAADQARRQRPETQENNHADKRRAEESDSEESEEDAQPSKDAGGRAGAWAEPAPMSRHQA